MPAGTWLDGACLEEATVVDVETCGKVFDCYKPNDLPPCIGDAELSVTDQKQCEIADLLADLNIDVTNAIDGSTVNAGKCTPDGRTIIHCVKKDADGNLIGLDAFAINPATGAAEPYSGECVKCNKQYNKVDLWVADPESEFCGYRVYECDGEKFVFNPTTCKYETLPEMLKVTTTNAGNSAKVCETLDVQLEITEPTEGTAADLIADAIAAGLTFPTYGAPAAEDALAITGQAAGPVVYGGQTGDCIADTEGVSASTAFDFTDPTCLPANLNVCFRKCLSAAEVKALPEGEGEVKG